MADVIRVLPLITIFCGVSNVLIIKWSDTLEAEDSTGLNRRFQHPLLQTTIMFLGQITCLIVYKFLLFFLARRGDDSENLNLITSGNREFSPEIFILPSLFDVIASILLLTSLYITNASSWQLIRGVSLLFVSFFGVHYLNHNLKIQHWLGMLFVIISLIMVIVYDVNYPIEYDWKAILTANLLVICSQIFHALQYVYEEKYIKAIDIAPMQAVGWQGVFGFILSLLLLIPLSFIKIGSPFNNNSNGSIEYLPDAFNQLHKNPALIVSHVIFFFSVAIYNYASVTIMKNTSSINRVIIDCFRVIPIYVISLFVQREVLSATIIIAFLILLSGVFTYKNIVFIQMYKWLIRKLTRQRYDDMDDQANVITSPADRAEA